MPTPHQNFPILWSVRHGRAATYPIHSSLGGHSSIPLFRGWPRGSPAWGLPPKTTLLKPPGLWERGKRYEFPNTDQSAQQNLKEQSRDSMVLEPYYRNEEEREKVEKREVGRRLERVRGREERREERRRQREREEEREVRKERGERTKE